MSFLEDLKKPFNIIMLAIAIIAIGLSVFFYYHGKKEMGLSYQITEPTSLIFDSKKTSSNIKLLEKDSIIVTDNVYLLTGTFWNSGDLPITQTDIRIPLSFKLGGAKRILDFKINKQRDSTVANFKIVKADLNSLKIDWDYFDPKFGFTFQVIYIGHENPEFKISGKILNITHFKIVKQKDKFFQITDIVMLFISLIASSFLSLSLIRKSKRNAKISVSDVFILIMYLMLVGFFIYIEFLSKVGNPI